MWFERFSKKTLVWYDQQWCKTKWFPCSVPGLLNYFPTSIMTRSCSERTNTKCFICALINIVFRLRRLCIEHPWGHRPMSIFHINPLRLQDLELILIQNPTQHLLFIFTHPFSRYIPLCLPPNALFSFISSASLCFSPKLCACIYSHPTEQVDESHHTDLFTTQWSMRGRGCGAALPAVRPWSGPGLLFDRWLAANKWQSGRLFLS